jgi:hypothetical protein
MIKDNRFRIFQIAIDNKHLFLLRKIALAEDMKRISGGSNAR